MVKISIDNVENKKETHESVDFAIEDDLMNKLLRLVDTLVSNLTSNGIQNSVNFDGSGNHGTNNIYNYVINNISNCPQPHEVKVKEIVLPPKEDFHIFKYLTECVEDKNLTEDERKLIDRTCLLDTDNNNKLKRIIAHSWQRQDRFDEDAFAQLLARVVVESLP